MAVDFSDPCQRYTALRDAYYLLISGGQESLVRYRGPNGEQEVRFGPGDIKSLKQEVDAAENACSVVNGTANPNRRYAIRGGARRQTVPVDLWTVPSWWFRP